MDSLIRAYCDGACSGNPGPGGWGAVLLLPDGTVRELGAPERSTTNNRMELAGAIAVLKAAADRPQTLRVFTDSGYVIQGITGWVFGWRRKGWKTFDGKPVANRELWEVLDALAQARRGRLEWVQVKGHAGHEVNERCDEIAVAFSKGRKPELYDGPAVGCGYSLLDPEPEQRREPGARRDSSSFSKAKPKGGTYLSFVDGRVERHATWPDCQKRVLGVSGARFKKVASPEEEQAALRSWGAA